MLKLGHYELSERRELDHFHDLLLGNKKETKPYHDLDTFSSLNASTIQVSHPFLHALVLFQTLRLTAKTPDLEENFSFVAVFTRYLTAHIGLHCEYCHTVTLCTDLARSDIAVSSQLPSSSLIHRPEAMSRGMHLPSR